VIALDCPELLGSWDPDRLEQVFSNLVGNAVLHGDPAKPVSICARSKDTEVEVAVQNHGPAIPPQLLNSLFNPFRRGERDGRTAKTAGLGLGLYISHEIVRAHGGAIAVDSDEVRGTTFRVTLPTRGQAAK
jgi:signal transduction histidine kinase